MTDVAEIARGLSPFQRDVLASQGRVLGMPYAASVMRPLVRRGLFERVERKGFQTCWQTTELGDQVARLAVRNYLKEQG